MRECCTMSIMSRIVIYPKKITCTYFNRIHDKPFWGSSRIGGREVVEKGRLPRICRTCPTLLKLTTVIPFLKKIQKINQLRDTTLQFS